MKKVIRFVCLAAIMLSMGFTSLAGDIPEGLLHADDAQIYYNRFMIFVLPVIIGLLLGICLWKIKRTYVVSGLMLLIGVAWYCVLAHINTHGSEGPGLLALMYFLLTLAFIVVEIIKFVVKKIKTRS